MAEKQMPRLNDFIKLNEYTYELPQSFRADMRVPARIFMSERMYDDIKDDRSLEQMVNVATLPGIVMASLAMPDIHQGYGFPIGGVAATDVQEGGVISPGGIGYDINCGVRLLALDVRHTDIATHVDALADALFQAVPSGVGKGGRIKLTLPELESVLSSGARHMLEQGYGQEGDLEYCEEGGSLAGARADKVSERAKKRGADQLGTLGSGNHFLEVQAVDKIFDEKAAEVFGLSLDQVVIMIHCGSRGLGHQVCTDYVRAMVDVQDEFGFTLPDRELICAPVLSDIGQDYFAAMAAAANFAWANRHMIGHWVRQACTEVLGKNVQVRTVYDVSHNMGKRETHLVHGKPRQLLVHRKGATRSFPAGHTEVPSAYQAVGQPVLIPGTMGTASYVLVGTNKAMEVAFGSCCHGAGRTMSRTKAKRMIRGTDLREELERYGITIRCDSDAGLAEEAPIAYKDVESVVEVVAGAQLAQRVARVKPVAVIKGG